MSLDIVSLVPAFITLLVVIDPVAITPLYVAMTKGADQAHRRAVAIRACAVGAVLLTLFGLFGEALLDFVGITMPAFRIAGGILLFITALDMLFERRTQRRQNQSANADDPSIFPLATPLIAGPGAIATMILLTGQADDLAAEVAIYVMMFVVILLVFIFFRSASLIERALGETGINVLTRLLGMLLAALSVQFVLDGLASFGFGPLPG